jgi:hypothetical protein
MIAGSASAPVAVSASAAAAPPNFFMRFMRFSRLVTGPGRFPAACPRTKIRGDPAGD